MDINSKLGRAHKTQGIIYNKKNSSLNYYGHDNGTRFKFGHTGLDPMSNHVTQDIHWDNIPVTYNFNGLGLRGPEPDYNAQTKIMFGGGSMLFGVGVNVEDTYAYKTAKALNASYINLSDCDTFTELMTELEVHVPIFKPNYIVLNDTRFFDEFGYAWLLFWLKVKKERSCEERDIIKYDLKSSLIQRNKKVLELALYKLVNTYKVPIIFISAFRKDYNFKGDINSQGAKVLYMQKDYLIDLARDNRHPGPLSHSKIANDLLAILK